MVTPSDIARGSKKNVTDLLTSEFLNKLELPLSTEFKSGEIWSQTISNLYKNYPDKPDFINKLQPVLNKKYPNLDLYTQWSNFLHLPWYLMLDDQLKYKRHKLTVKIANDKNQKSLGNACRIFYFLVNLIRSII
jgi:hypothetical protein